METFFSYLFLENFSEFFIILISLTPALPIIAELLFLMRSSDPLHRATSSSFFVSITITELRSLLSLFNW